ncbi:4Fe-4S dicluster domain-containing protein [candidate division KSB1 bacterium]
MKRRHFQQLIDRLYESGYKVIGPTHRHDAVIYDEISAVDQLPVGWVNEQDSGTYQLKKGTEGMLFGYSTSPSSWKRFLFPPEIRLWKATIPGEIIQVIQEKGNQVKYAFLGVRSCELHALGVHDRIFSDGQYQDHNYSTLRKNCFIVAVNCIEPGNNCFCASTGTGPSVKGGFDLCMTEIADNEQHYFVVEVGSKRGAKVFSHVPHTVAGKHHLKVVREKEKEAVNKMGRTVDLEDINHKLMNNFDHPVWDEIADRCLTCGNCTMICPTCFCTTVEDETDLTGENASRIRKWDSCFSLDFSYIFGGSIRSSPKARYRHWVIHKFSSWLDQFDVGGCVGCGRCITWCPAGIDITRVLRVIQHSENMVFDKLK